MALAEINVTPLVDVMLVLLIIFMISAPLMQQGTTVDLPKADTGSMNDVPDQIILVVTKDKKIEMNGKTLPPGVLRKKLKAIASVKPEVQVYIEADQAIPYGFVAQVIAEVKKADITRVGLVTQPSAKDVKL